MFSRRIQKSKIKDLEKSLREARDPYAAQRVEEELKKVKKDVFTDERKIEQRKMGFHKAKVNLKKT